MGEIAGEKSGSKRDQETKMESTTYDKKLTVLVDIVGEERITMMDMLRKVKEDCGVVTGCRYKTPKQYEVTMQTSTGKERLMDGVKIRDSRILARDIQTDEMVVSFLALPIYMEDKEIHEKLREWGVKAVSRIRRRMWPGTDIADGTRYVKVKFTETVKSLPYSTKFLV